MAWRVEFAEFRSWVLGSTGMFSKTFLLVTLLLIIFLFCLSVFWNLRSSSIGLSLKRALWICSEVCNLLFWQNQGLLRKYSIFWNSLLDDYPTLVYQNERHVGLESVLEFIKKKVLGFFSFSVAHMSKMIWT